MRRRILIPLPFAALATLAACQSSERRAADSAAATDSAAVNALLSSPPARTIDLSGRLGDAVEALPGYEGVGW